MKLTTSEAVAILLCHGHICEAFYTKYKRPYYGVYQTIRTPRQIGHITPKQFQEMIEADLIEQSGSRTDKYGNIYHYYHIPSKEDTE